MPATPFLYHLKPTDSIIVSAGQVFCKISMLRQSKKSKRHRQMMTLCFLSLYLDDNERHNEIIFTYG